MNWVYLPIRGAKVLIFFYSERKKSKNLKKIQFVREYEIEKDWEEEISLVEDFT